MRSYRNSIWDLIDNLFHAFNITVVPREENQKDDASEVASSNFNPPIQIRVRNEVEMFYIPLVYDNTKHYQVFEDDQEIHLFLELGDEFSNTCIDQQ